MLPYFAPGQTSLTGPLVTGHHIEPEFPRGGAHVLNPVEYRKELVFLFLRISPTASGLLR